MEREEDNAYSLLGIFKVHMPLIYGEGKDNAFRRLREETDKSPKDLLQQHASGQSRRMQVDMVRDIEGVSQG
jgi:hypothetical protein